MPDTHTLVVVTKSADALPEATWWKIPPKYFELQVAYSHFNDKELACRAFPKECIGFYAIEPKEPYPETLTCDLCRNKIRIILIVKACPWQTIEWYKEGGIDHLTKIAAKVYVFEAAQPQTLAA